MKVLKDAAVKGAHGDDLELTARVRGIIADIAERGEVAVRELSEQFDVWAPEQFRLSSSQLDEIISSVDPATIADIEFAQKQIRNFAEVQRASMHDVEVETLPGVFLVTNISRSETWGVTCQEADIQWWLRHT